MDNVQWIGTPTRMNNVFQPPIVHYPLYIIHLLSMKRFVFGLFWLISSTLASAQTSPAPLSLPFFDDFSTANTAPDTQNWLSGSGVYINNTTGISHPSVNLATFDGLKANGFPYNFNSQFAQGYTDTLTSQPITLAGLSPRDSVYLSFYWQRTRFGELPDLGDSLKLEFLDRSGQWAQVWFQVGGQPDLNAQRAFIAVTDSRFMHAGFQFRFRSYGRQSGAFDTWNLDYVYMNRGRSVFDRFIKDITTRLPLTPFLKRYTAMPLKQYLANPAAETADSISTDINNLFNNFNPVTFRFTTQELVTGQVVQNLFDSTSTIIQSLANQKKIIRPTPLPTNFARSRAVLRHKFSVLTTDNQNPSIPTIDLRRNDTISSQTVLDNYFAYDDGSAEYALQIGQRERVAIRFVLNKADVLTGIQACLMPFKTDQTGQQFTVNVYSSNRGKPGTAIFAQSFPMQYPAMRNGFVEFTFNRAVAVTDTFYVGYTQISADDNAIVRLGFDRNSPFGKQIFYNPGSGNWEQNLSSAALSEPGAFLFRPIIGGNIVNTVVTGITQPEPLPANLQVYPNPTTGSIGWDNAALNQIEVLDATGRLVQEIRPAPGQQTADLSALPTGFYLLRLSDGQRTTVQRLILAR
jgi:Secretion system C-terminal sorting domain